MQTMEMGPKDYMQVLKRRQGSLIGTAIVIFLLAITVALVLPSTYKSSSTILIEEQEIPAEYVMTTVTSYAEQQLQVTNQRIMSTTKLLEIIDRHSLYQDLKEDYTTEEIIEEMRGNIHLDLINADVMDRRTGRPATATIAFTLSFEAEEPPAKVLQTASTLASLFLQENLKVREEQASGTLAFLGDEAEKVKIDLRILEKRMQEFKEKNANSLPELLQVNLQNLQRMELNLDRLRETLRSQHEREGFLQTQLASIPESGLTSKSRLDQLYVQLAELNTNFSDEYPDVIKTKAEIAELESIMSSANKGKNTIIDDAVYDPTYISVASQLSSTQADIASLEKQISGLESKVDEYTARIETTTMIEGEYQSLVNERNNTEAKYNDLLVKAMEAKVSQGLEKEQKGGRFTLIDPARLPEKPSKPNRLAIILIGIVLGIGGGFGMMAMLEFLDESIRNPVALTYATSFPVLGSVPEIETELDKKKNKRRKVILLVSIIIGIAAAVAVFHFVFMDLNVFWAKLSRKLALIVP